MALSIQRCFEQYHHNGFKRSVLFAHVQGAMDLYADDLSLSNVQVDRDTLLVMSIAYMSRSYNVGAKRVLQHGEATLGLFQHDAGMAQRRVLNWASRLQMKTLNHYHNLYRSTAA